MGTRGLRARPRFVQCTAGPGASASEGEGRPAGRAGDHRVGRVHGASRCRRFGRGAPTGERVPAVDPLPGRRDRPEGRSPLLDRPAPVRGGAAPRRGRRRAGEVPARAGAEELRAGGGPALEPRYLAGGVGHPRVERAAGRGVGRGGPGGGGRGQARRRVHARVRAGRRARRAEARHRGEPHQRGCGDAGHAAHDDRVARSDLCVLRGRRGVVPQVRPPRPLGAAAELTRVQEPGARGARRRGRLPARRRHGLRRQSARSRHGDDRRQGAPSESRPEPHPGALRPPAAAWQRPVPGDPPPRRGDRERPVAEVRLPGRRREQGPVPHGEDRAAGRRPARRPRGRHAGRLGRGGRSPAGGARVQGRRAAGDDPVAVDGRGRAGDHLEDGGVRGGAPMTISRFFIDRPIFAAVLSIVTLILGGLAYGTLPVAQYPEVVPPTIVVQASYPGAPPEVIADTVATPIEQEVNGVEDMLYMSSQSTTDGNMTLTITFRLGTDLDKAQVLVQNRVAIAEPRLPEDVRRVGVTTLKSSPDLLMVVHLLSPTKRYDQLYIGNFALIRVRDALRRLEGVGDVNLFGLREYSMRVWLDPGRLASRNIATSDVVQALREQNVQVASGAVGQAPLPTGHAFQLPVTTLGRLREPEEFENIVVKTGADGRITRVRDVARIELAARDYSVNSYLDNQPAVAMAVAQLPGSNALATADAVERTMEELSRSFPEGLTYKIVYNPTVFVRESINEVLRTLFEAVGLVVLVVLVFLQTWRATLIPLLAIPVSLVGTCAAMAAFGFSLNMLSLFGLVLAIGIVVDDAIVVVENVERHIAEGLAPREAAHRAMDEVTGAVIAIAFGLSAVFVPTAFLGGIAGQFYRQFALTIAVATILSAFNSLTLSPAMCALLLQPEGAEKDWFGRLWDRLFGRFFRAFNRVFERTSHRYGGAVGRLVRRPALALTI